MCGSGKFSEWGTSCILGWSRGRRSDDETERVGVGAERETWGRDERTTDPEDPVPKTHTQTTKWRSRALGLDICVCPEVHTGNTSNLSNVSRLPFRPLLARSRFRSLDTHSEVYQNKLAL